MEATTVRQRPDPQTRGPRLVGGVCGVVGALMLAVYFSSPVKLPGDSATVDQVASFAAHHRDFILLGAWVQGIGSALGVVFFLGLVHASRARDRLAGSVVIVGSAVLLGLSVVEGIFFIDVSQATANGHALTALGSFDLQTIFIHGFLTVAAPMVYLATGAVLWNSKLLPNRYAAAAFAIGISFEVLGFAGLFYKTADSIAVVVLIAQAVWILTASCHLLLGLRAPPSDERILASS